MTLESMEMTTVLSRQVIDLVIELVSTGLSMLIVPSHDVTRFHCRVMLRSSMATIL